METKAVDEAGGSILVLDEEVRYVAIWAGSVSDVAVIQNDHKARVRLLYRNAHI